MYFESQFSIFQPLNVPYAYNWPYKLGINSPLQSFPLCDRFILTFRPIEESVPSGENQSVTGGDEEAVDEYQELNAREEQDIEIMMEGCEYAISNAEAFAEKLSRELQVLDGVRLLMPCERVLGGRWRRPVVFMLHCLSTQALRA